MKKFLALTLAAVMALSLAACGGAPAPSTPVVSAPESGTTPASLSGSVVYWSMWQETEPQADILKAAVARFEKANPDVTVEVEWSGRDVKNLVSAAVQAGEQVDLFDSDPTSFYQTDPTIMMDLTDFYDSLSLDGTTKLSDAILTGLIDWDKGLSKDYADGKSHSVPYNPYCIDFFYNTEHFKAAGIEKVPETWEELDAVCAKLKQAGFEPIVTDDAYFSMMFKYYVARYSGEDAIKEMVKTNNFDDPGMLAALKALEDFASKGYFAASCKTNKYPAGQQQFARQEASMYFNASFMAAENAETAGDDFPYGHFAYPVVPDGSGKITENSIGGQAFVVNANTENKDAAYELLRYFVGEDCQKDFLDHGLTPNLSSLDWPASMAGQKPIVAAVTKNINWGASMGGEIADSVIDPAVKAVMLGEQSADAAYAAIVKAGKNAG
ncbi:ABC transporter substrate-binding protein [Allofournierella sp.]|uniref:ABC transporter substrate-binding protein n=1 Tax=Allofournierella sp. TaxID=1940256 RepID=UPI003AB3BDBB